MRILHDEKQSDTEDTSTDKRHLKEIKLDWTRSLHGRTEVDNNFKMSVRETNSEDVRWMELAHYHIQRCSTLGLSKITIGKTKDIQIEYLLPTEQ